MTQDQEVLTAGVVQVGGEEDGVIRTPGEEKDRVGRGGTPESRWGTVAQDASTYKFILLL